jgi:large subunit ribosomal protein L17
MRKRVFGRRLSRDTNERKALFRTLAVSFITHGRIDTTEAKAKAVRPFIEKLVTQSKVDSLNSRRNLLSRLPNTQIVEKLLTSVGPTFVKRPGGYTRLTRLGPRLGDNAPIVRLEFVEELKPSPEKKPTKFATKKANSKIKAEAATKTPVKKPTRVAKSKLATAKK